MSARPRPGWLVTILWIRDVLAFHRRRPRARHYIAAAAVAAALAGVGGGSLATQPTYNTDGSGGHESSIGSPFTQHRCGVERWDVKTGTDSLAGQVQLTPQATSISALTALPAPSSWPPPARLRAESATYSLTVTLREFKLESDSDYHLVLADAAGATMIGEIPDPGCVGAASPFRSAIAQARQAFDQSFHATPSLQPADAQVSVSGVLFFDKLHGQAGVAGNGVELHPILSLKEGG